MTGDVHVPRLLSVREAAQITGLGRWRLYSLFDEGKGPPHMRVGRTIRISEVELLAWIEQQHDASKKEG